MKKATTVKIDRATQKTLKDLAEQAGESMNAVLQKAIEEYRRRHFFNQLDAAVEILQRDPNAWGEELEERTLWEATLMDGLEPDESGTRDRVGSRKSKRRKSCD